MDTFAWSAEGMRPSKNAPTLFVRAHEVPPAMPVTLENKLALVFWYLEEVRSKRRHADEKALNSFLDDAEVAGWLDTMRKTGRIINTRFTERNPR